MYRETHWRSIAKTISYRFWGTGTTAGVVFLLTGQGGVALALAGIDVTSKLVVFFLHERMWSRINFGRKRVKPFVLWFTGLSGSGKTTLSKEVAKRLQAKGLTVEHLDGDKVRSLFPSTGFTRSERAEHLRRVGLLASYLERNGVIVVASFISPYEESRKFLRNHCSNYVEVHVSTPLEECERRDVKGLYAKARRGEIAHFTGIDEPYEAPNDSEIEVDTSKLSMEESLEIIMKRVRRYVE